MGWTDLVAVVAGVLLLAAVPGDVSGAVTLVAAILLLATLPGKMSEPVALVALAAAAAATAVAITIASSAATVTVSAISLGALAGKVAYSITPTTLNRCTAQAEIRA